MFSSSIKAGTCSGCATPTVIRTNATTGGVSPVSIGDPDPNRIVIVAGGQQGSSGVYNPTLNGVAPLILYNGGTTGNGTTFFGIFKIPTGTTATASGMGNPFLVYSIYGWPNFKVLQFNSFAGGDSLDFSFTSVPLPANTLVLGNWATNEDGDASLKQWNFGVSTRYFFNGGETDAGGAFELLTTPFPTGRATVCDSAGKRRSYGFLAITCGNAFK